jgi:Cu-Zn family superoxide dismutase
MFFFLSACSSTEPSANVIVPVKLTRISAVEQSIGTVELQDTQYGLLLVPNLTNLKPGLHGFHAHTNANCQAADKDGKPVPGLAAGGHYDPDNTKVHKGPYQSGHLGDLPPLAVAENGKASLPVLAPRLKIADLQGRSLIIHAAGDNYSDQPEPLGGGGARIACGIAS